MFQEASVSTSSTTTSMKQSCEDCGLHMKSCYPAYKVVFYYGDWIDVGFRRTPPNTTSPTTKITCSDDCSTNRYNVVEAELLS
jgi:hypothetical protein